MLCRSGCRRGKRRDKERSPVVRKGGGTDQRAAQDLGGGRVNRAAVVLTGEVPKAWLGPSTGAVWRTSDDPRGVANPSSRRRSFPLVAGLVSGNPYGIHGLLEVGISA